MVKKKSVPYCTIADNILESSAFKSLTDRAKVLYMYLCKAENIFSRDGNQFFRSNSDLARDAGFSIDKLKRAKRELIESGFIKINIDSAGKTERITYYHLPETTELVTAKEMIRSMRELFNQRVEEKTDDDIKF